MEETCVLSFRDSIMQGDLDNIPEQVSQLLGTQEMECTKKEFIRQEQQRLIEYLLFEQKYMELLEMGQTLAAIQLLQTELRSRAPEKERLNDLAQLILVRPNKKGEADDERTYSDYGSDIVNQEKEVNGNLKETKTIRTHKRVCLDSHAPWWQGSGPKGRASLLNKVQNILNSNAMM